MILYNYYIIFYICILINYNLLLKNDHDKINIVNYFIFDKNVTNLFGIESFSIYS